TGFAFADFNHDGRLDFLGTGCGGLLTVTASVSSTSTDPDSTNNSATATTQIKPLPPTITTSPATVPLGGIFTITGTNSSDPFITVNGILANIIACSPTQITAFVPPGAQTGSMMLTTPSATVTPNPA